MYCLCIGMYFSKITGLSVTKLIISCSPNSGKKNKAATDLKHTHSVSDRRSVICSMSNCHV